MGESDVNYNEDNRLFGFRWLSTFLYNISVELSQIATGFVLWICSSYHPEKSKSKKVFQLISVSIVLVGFFFMAWIFTDALYFSRVYEVIFAIAISIVATSISVLLMLVLSKEIRIIDELKSKIRFAMRKMTVDAVKGNHVMNKKRWQEEIVEPTLDKLHE